MFIGAVLFVRARTHLPKLRHAAVQRRGWRRHQSGWQQIGRGLQQVLAHGQFTEPNLTVDEMMEKVRGKIGDMHFPSFLADVFVKGIPKLKRWQR